MFQASIGGIYFFGLFSDGQAKRMRYMVFGENPKNANICKFGRNRGKKGPKEEGRPGLDGRATSLTRQLQTTIASILHM